VSRSTNNAWSQNSGKHLLRAGAKQNSRAGSANTFSFEHISVVDWCSPFLGMGALRLTIRFGWRWPRGFRRWYMAGHRANLSWQSRMPLPARRGKTLFPPLAAPCAGSSRTGLTPLPAPSTMEEHFLAHLSLFGGLLGGWRTLPCLRDRHTTTGHLLRGVHGESRLPHLFSTCCTPWAPLSGHGWLPPPPFPLDLRLGPGWHTPQPPSSWRTGRRPWQQPPFNTLPAPQPLPHPNILPSRVLFTLDSTGLPAYNHYHHLPFSNMVGTSWDYGIHLGMLHPHPYLDMAKGTGTSDLGIWA